MVKQRNTQSSTRQKSAEKTEKARQQRTNNDKRHHVMRSAHLRAAPATITSLEHSTAQSQHLFRQVINALDVHLR